MNAGFPSATIAGLLNQVPDARPPKRSDRLSAGVKECEERVAQVQGAGGPPSCGKQRQGHAGAVSAEGRLTGTGCGDKLDLLGPDHGAGPRAREGAQAEGKDAERAQGEAPKAPLLLLELGEASRNLGHVWGRHKSCLQAREARR
jgi:hypothetical protein